jgi:hypothetical protein
MMFSSLQDSFEAAVWHNPGRFWERKSGREP